MHDGRAITCALFSRDCYELIAFSTEVTPRAVAIWTVHVAFAGVEVQLRGCPTEGGDEAIIQLTSHLHYDLIRVEVKKGGHLREFPTSWSLCQSIDDVESGKETH